MSGGHYDYSYGRIRDLADAIHGDIKKCSTQRKGYFEDEIIEPLPVATLDALRFVAGLLEVASEAAYSVEWMMSGDTGDDDLIRAVEAAKRKLNDLMKVGPQ